MAFQDQLLFPHLTALENVAFGPRTAGASRADARRTARAGSTGSASATSRPASPASCPVDRPSASSIARALANDPRVLLLDEPFAGLDVSVAAGLRVELARHLAAYDGVTLLVTHDAIDALTLADVVWVLEGGALVQVGPPREVAARPLTHHVARLVGLNVLHEGDRFWSFSPSGVTSPRGALRLGPPPLAGDGDQPGAPWRRRTPARLGSARAARRRRRRRRSPSSSSRRDARCGCRSRRRPWTPTTPGPTAADR